MRLAIIAVLLIVAIPVAGRAQERTYAFQELSPAEVRYLGVLLGKQSIDEAGALYSKLQTQITQQDQAAQAAVVENFRKQTRSQMEKESKPPNGEPKP